MYVWLAHWLAGWRVMLLLNNSAGHKKGKRTYINFPISNNNNNKKREILSL